MVQSVEAEDFTAFWAKFPRRVGKRDAMKAWERLTAPQRAKALEVIGAHVAYWQRAGRTAETIPHPATWLNGWRFEDELPEKVQHRGRFNATEYARRARDQAFAESMDGRTAAPALDDLRGPAGRRSH